MDLLVSIFQQFFVLLVTYYTLVESIIDEL